MQAPDTGELRPSPLASYQEKVLSLDDHLGVSFAGLTADAKSLGRWMRMECLNSRYFHNTPLRYDVTTLSIMGELARYCFSGICISRFGSIHAPYSYFTPSPG